MVLARILATAAVLLAGGCRLYLDEDKACGDGYIDRAAGEQCEPQDEASFRDACRTQLNINRPGSCSPLSCEFDLSACYPACGNGVLDGGEECDPGTPEPEAPASTGQPEDDDQIGTELSCTLFDPIDGGDPYAGGVLETCQANCTWDRTPCHRCGDGQLQQDESCDGNLVDLGTLDQLCLAECVPQAQGPRPERVFCKARCSSSCGGYVVDDDPGCCIPNGHPADVNLPCCGYEEDGECKLGLGE